MTQVVTRFAPSPTGFLHIGGARTALFSWLLARSKGGKFLLRVEDTDRERSTQEATDAILDSMRWLGLDWEGEPIFQSRRNDVYNAYIDKLLASGRAYWCSCSPDEVEAMRERARAEGRKPKYDGRCRERGLAAGPGRVVRFKAPLDGSTAYRDLVKGPIAVDNAELDDMILRRSDGTPTYNLAVVVDDHEMGVTHVLRGDDHVANTPKQILLYQAFGWTVPEFGHVPMILGPDKKKLSKRHGALSVMEYEKMGYLPEAVVNYLARLGWSHGDQEIFSRQELVACFDTANLGNSPAVFDTQKLEWLNGHYMKQADPKRLARLMYEVLRLEMTAEEFQAVREDYLARIAPLLQTRAKTLVEMAEMSRLFLVDAAFLDFDERAVKQHLTEDNKRLLEEYIRALESEPQCDFTEQALEERTTAFLEGRALKFKALAQPVRVALTGRTVSPGLFETMHALGKEQTLKRLNRALEL